MREETPSVDRLEQELENAAAVKMKEIILNDPKDPALNNLKKKQEEAQ
jgi:hypothetical protein